MSYRAGGIGVGLLMLIIGAGLVVLALNQLDVLEIGLFDELLELLGELVGSEPQLQGAGLVSGGMLLIIGLVLMYKGASQKQAKESV